MTGPWHNPERQSTSFEAITVSTTALGLTLANYQGAVAAEITVENGPIRFRTDGVAATATVGHLLSAGSVLYIDNPNELAKLSMIRDDTVDGDISVSYFNR
jgi:hypothetical protein